MERLRRPGKFTHNDVKEILQQLISALAENNRKVELTDDFFVKANIRITKKNRNRPRKRLLISEKDTSQENITNETTKFHFKTSFEETTSVSLATSQGFSANVGGGLSGGAAGASLGLSSGLEYSKSKSFGQDKSRAQNKELTAEVDVRPNTVVIVKELTYEVEWAAMCDLELVLKKEDQIEYKCTGRWRKEQTNYIEVKKLLKRLTARLKKHASSSSLASRTQKNALVQSPVDYGFSNLQLSSFAVMAADSPRPSSTSLETLPETEIRPTPPSLKSNTTLTGDQHGSSTVEHTESSPVPPSPKSNTTLTGDQHGSSTVEHTESSPVPPSPKSNTTLTGDQHGSSTVEHTESSPVPPSPKSNTTLTGDQHGSSTVEHTESSPVPPSPKSNTTLTGDQHGSSAVEHTESSPVPTSEGQHRLSTIEHIKETESSPTPPSPKSNTSLTGDQLKTSSVEHGPTPKAKSVQFEVLFQPTELVTVHRNPSPDYYNIPASVYDPSQVPAHVITDPRVLLTEHMLVIEFTSDCLFSAEEHKLEIIKLPSNSERVKRIIDHQTGVASQNDEEDMLLSLKNDKYV